MKYQKNNVLGKERKLSKKGKNRIKEKKVELEETKNLRSIEWKNRVRMKTRKWRKEWGQNMEIIIQKEINELSKYKVIA